MTTPNINSLISGLQKTDPKLYEALKAISADLAQINATLYPFIAASSAAVRDVEVAPPTDFSFVLLPRAVQFSWSASENAFAYEIREGTEWNTADFVLRTVSLSGAINPILVGTHDYLIKSISRGGNYSVESTALSITVNKPGSVTVLSSVIDNNVMLRWTTSITDFQLDYYVVIKNGIEIGRLTGTFISIFETSSGEYTYGVYAVDVAGNVSDTTAVVAVVNQPPDFVLENEITSDLNGTLVNCKLEAGPQLLVSIPTGRTWAEHFTDNSWTTIQEQIDAGYPIYAEPAVLNGSAELKFDFGAIFESVIINTTWSEQVIGGDVQVTAEIKYSDDDITYTAYVSGTTLFATSLRYVKVKLSFIGDDDTSLSYIYDVICAINVKREMDGGTVQVFAADPSGTAVTFNKAFKDVESITTTPQSTVQQTANVDFTDIPYPTTFYIYLYDDTGVRIDGTVAWKARGVL